MLYCIARSKTSVASGYIHQAAWRTESHRKELVFARIAGRPTMVKSIAATLMRGQDIVTYQEKQSTYYYPAERGRCLYQKIVKDSKHIGIATYYSVELFNKNSAATQIVGYDDTFLRDTFDRLVRHKPIFNLPQWDLIKLFQSEQLCTNLETYNCKGMEVMWTPDQINQRIAELVKTGQLTLN